MDPDKDFPDTMRSIGFDKTQRMVRDNSSDNTRDSTQRAPGQDTPRSSPLRAVMFADVSGSTHLYETLGDRKALAVIERCIKVMTHATQQNGGRLIKTIGDEVLVVFPDVPSGCRAAIDMQFGILSLPESMELGTSIYCGLHWGEVTFTDNDIFGDTVNVAARTVQAAKKGQIVISGEAMRLLPAELNGKTRFLGADSVKGKAEPIEMYELLWESDADLTEMVSHRASAREIPIGMSLSYLGNKYGVSKAQPLLTLGRDPSSGLITVDKLASRNHGRIFKEKDRFTYTDFSSNGTYIRLEGHDEVFVRRDAMVLTGSSGTISFGRPYKEDSKIAIEFQISAAHG